MADKFISQLNAATLSKSDFVAVDNSTTTGKTSVGELLAHASGISSDSAYILCSDSSTNMAVSGHYIPVTNSDYDLGSAEYKIRHLFLSDNSIFMGDLGNKIGVQDDQIAFTLQDEQVVNPTMKVSVPPNSNHPAKAGSFAFDAQYFYVCFQDNQWARLSIASFETGF